VPIRTQLSDEEVARFAANRYRFPAIELNARLFRQYPQGEIFSHVVGHIGRINQRELGEFEREGQSAHYRGTTSIGKTGLENRYEKYLHGNPGVEEVEVDAAGRAVRTLSRQQPVSGSNLVLTLDAKLQEVAYRALNGRRGALVALEPATGGVLAFVSTPGFDPNLFVDGIDPQSWKALNDSPDRPMVNRALSGTYPPGSTFKPFMALAGLTFGRLQPERSILDAGYFVLGGRQFRDQKVGGHGMVNMFMSIVESCNTYYYMLANELGIDNIASFMARFGFGSRTGIDLNGESKGTLPSQSWKMQRFRQKWYSGETINVGIGQGYNAYTPLQLAQAIAVIANDGQTYRPRVVDYIENAATAERIMIEPQPLPSLDLDPEHLKVIQRALSGVSREGTAARAFTDAQYTSAGKTGTAQIAINSGQKDIESGVPERQRDHSLYVAYAPVDNPRIALAVIVENAGFGARAAAPIARQVFDYYLLGT
jgi:penicillin-binding protein 2